MKLRRSLAAVVLALFGFAMVGCEAEDPAGDPLQDSPAPAATDPALDDPAATPLDTATPTPEG